MQEKCCFYLLGGGCSILKVPYCQPDGCKFCKTKQEFEDGAERAKQILQSKGLVAVHKSVDGCEIVTVQKVGDVVDHR